MVKKIFQLSRKLIKKIFVKFNLVSPDNEKPIFFYKTWDRYFTLSILMSDSFKKLKEQNLENIYIAEAGIGKGTTFEYLALIAEKIGSRIVGFDSFKGFPEIKNPAPMGSNFFKTLYCSFETNFVYLSPNKFSNCLVALI